MQHGQELLLRNQLLKSVPLLFLSLANRVYLMDKARVGFSGTVEGLDANPEIRAKSLEV